MVLFADFHFHSKYSRAVSPEMNLEGLNAGALRKGLGLIGTGDFTHPAWLKELKSKLVEVDGTGFFKLSGSNSPILYTLTAEVATFLPGKRVHHVIHAPSFAAVDQLNEIFCKWGNLAADGRPMFASTSGAAVVEACMSVDKKLLVYPAHAWTPYFGVLGSISGYESIEKGYEDQAKYIYALETGMSSSPDMNWRISSLDKYCLLSNSDAHSNHPWRLGRECNAFNFSRENISYGKLFDAIRNKELAFTVEVDPNYGKYHYDGHRLCKFSCSPAETRKLQGRCPVCKRSLTIGVESRVEKLADRPEGYLPKNAVPFKKVLPLHELVASVYSSALTTNKVMTVAESLITHFGSELHVLLNAPLDEIAKLSHPKIARVVELNREGKLRVKAGFDGEYGVLQLEGELLLEKKEAKEPKEKEGKQLPQKTLGEFSE